MASVSGNDLLPIWLQQPDAQQRPASREMPQLSLSSPNRSSEGGRRSSRGRPASRELQMPDAMPAEKRSPLLLKCAHIQDTLLRRADPQLHGVLAEKEVQPQLYLLRWLRLLFGREFHLADSMLVWDALFAYGQAASCPCHAVLFAHAPRLPACSFRACNSSSTWLWRCCCTCVPRLSRGTTRRRSAARAGCSRRSAA